jgi:hypothetical protein
MPHGSDAQFLQVLRRQASEDFLIDGVLAECRRIFFEAKAPQPRFKLQCLSPLLKDVAPSQVKCWLKATPSRTPRIEFGQRQLAVLDGLPAKVLAIELEGMTLGA